MGKCTRFASKDHVALPCPAYAAAEPLHNPLPTPNPKPILLPLTRSKRLTRKNGQNSNTSRATGFSVRGLITTKDLNLIGWLRVHCKPRSTKRRPFVASLRANSVL